MCTLGRLASSCKPRIERGQRVFLWVVEREGRGAAGYSARHNAPRHHPRASCASRKKPRVSCSSIFTCLDYLGRRSRVCPSRHPLRSPRSETQRIFPQSGKIGKQLQAGCHGAENPDPQSLRAEALPAPEIPVTMTVPCRGLHGGFGGRRAESHGTQAWKRHGNPTTERRLCALLEAMSGRRKGPAHPLRPPQGLASGMGGAIGLMGMECSGNLDQLHLAVATAVEHKQFSR